MGEGVQHDVFEAALAGNPLDVLDEFGFQPTWRRLVLRLAMDKDDGRVGYLDFATPVVGVGQRFLKRAECELPGKEHQEFHGIAPTIATIGALSVPSTR